MINSEPIVEINRSEGFLSVKAIMPTWNKLDENGHICIRMPLLGADAITHALNDDDAEVAVNEAFQCFCMVSEKHGMGLENELEFIGWKKEPNSDKNKSILTLNSDVPAYDSIMDTGDTRVLEYSL